MATTEDDDKAIIRSVRFKPAQWAAVVEHTAKYGINRGSFLRNAALKAAGYATEVGSMRDTASALARAVDMLEEGPVSAAGPVASPAPPPAAGPVASARARRSR